MMFRLVVQCARCVFSRVEVLVEFKLAFELEVLDGASLKRKCYGSNCSWLF